MSSNKLSLDSIEKFLEKLRLANRSRSKDIRLTIEEAQELGTTISQVLVRQSSLLEEIVELQKRGGDPVINIDMSGGNFK